MYNLRTEPTFLGLPMTKKAQKVSKDKDRIPYNRKYGNSPTFTFTNGALTTTSSETIDIHEDKPESRKYGVMNQMTIANASSYAIRIYPNQDTERYFIVPGGSIRIFDESDLNAGVLSFRIYNQGSGTISANEITIEVYKKGVTTEGTLQNINKKIFNFVRK
jgi:hypothetical protein